MTVDGQVGEESLNVDGRELARVPPEPVALGESDVMGDPGDVALLGAIGVVADAQDVPNLIEELHVWPLGRDRSRRGLNGE